MGIRTPDLLHAMQALYQLSYSPSSPAVRAGLSATAQQRHASVQETWAHSSPGARCRRAPGTSRSQEPAACELSAGGGPPESHRWCWGRAAGPAS